MKINVDGKVYKITLIEPKRHESEGATR